MKKVKLILLMIVLSISFSAFIQHFPGDKPVPIPKYPQRSGDAKLGYDYLMKGDYVKGGIPYNIFLLANGQQKKYLQRDSLNNKLPHDFNAILADNGQVLVAPNCLQCHAQVFNGELIIGLGNSLVDFTKNEKLNPKNFEILENLLRLNPKNHAAAEFFLNVSKIVTPGILADVRGVNTADRLGAILAAHRDPVSFKWSDQPLLEIPDKVIPTDTPAWWLLKKKNAMFYNGFGRGDFGKFLMASSLLAVKDTFQTREVDQHMPDVLAYINSLEAPKYPLPLNQELVIKGKTIFEKKCSSCHGTYGKKEKYPNLLIPQSIIKTDSLLYQSNYLNPQFIDWFNKSWFTTGPYPSQLVPFKGYIAPPLDGIWITAPYLHNGSVPTIEAVLNSSLRPRYWSRDFNNPVYDLENPGWKYSSRLEPANNTIYNTDLPGYGNYGHYFGDVLKESERKAVIEYLKTL